VMIAGPEGTPYAGRLFEFDCFLTLDYPHKPPLMHLRTTAGGRVRFNPNLYSKARYFCLCVPLVRPEEQWSTKSTLLQVFVSIQSMILIDMPYFND
ncbi:ubiquitin-conjugating enzyme/RWD-like protein, partial [Cytidiella melzeri]